MYQNIKLIILWNSIIIHIELYYFDKPATTDGFKCLFFIIMYIITSYTSVSFFLVLRPKSEVPTVPTCIQYPTTKAVNI